MTVFPLNFIIFPEPCRVNEKMGQQVHNEKVRVMGRWGGERQVGVVEVGWNDKWIICAHTIAQ